MAIVNSTETGGKEGEYRKGADEAGRNNSRVIKERGGCSLIPLTRGGEESKGGQNHPPPPESSITTAEGGGEKKRIKKKGSFAKNCKYYSKRGRGG